MACVFKTGDLEALRKIFSDDLKFSGPFYNFDSADDYVNALRNNPPKNFKYKIIKSYFDNHSSCLIYEFLKLRVLTTMFEIVDGKISHVLLIFDSRSFQSDLNEK
jgi:hypothetical protein